MFPMGIDAGAMFGRRWGSWRMFGWQSSLACCSCFGKLVASSCCWPISAETNLNRSPALLKSLAPIPKFVRAASGAIRDGDFRSGSFFLVFLAAGSFVRHDNLGWQTQQSETSKTYRSLFARLGIS